MKKNEKQGRSSEKRLQQYVKIVTPEKTRQCVTRKHPINDNRRNWAMDEVTTIRKRKCFESTCLKGTSIKDWISPPLNSNFTPHLHNLS